MGIGKVLKSPPKSCDLFSSKINSHCNNIVGGKNLIALLKVKRFLEKQSSCLEGYLLQNIFKFGLGKSGLFLLGK